MTYVIFKVFISKKKKIPVTSSVTISIINVTNSQDKKLILEELNRNVILK